MCHIIDGLGNWETTEKTRAADIHDNVMHLSVLIISDSINITFSNSMFCETHHLFVDVMNLCRFSK